MTLDEAIKHCDDVIQEKMEDVHVSMKPKSNQECIECAKEHEQLKEWLEDYKKILNENKALKRELLHYQRICKIKQNKIDELLIENYKYRW